MTLQSASMPGAHFTSAPQVESFETEYQRGLTRALWRYMQDQSLKEYIDGVQQEFGCCGGTRVLGLVCCGLVPT